MKTKNLSKRFICFALTVIIIFALFAGLPSVNLNVTAEEVIYETAPAMSLKLLLIDFDPVLPTRNGVRMGEYIGYGWGHLPEGDLIDNILYLTQKLKTASHGIINYDRIEYLYVNEFPLQASGFSVDPETFPDIWDEATAAQWNYWDHPAIQSLNQGYFDFDYMHYIERFNLIERRNNGEFDEVWMVSEFSGAYETVMVGRGAYWINGIAIEADCAPFRINSIARQRFDTPLENLAHSAESILTTVYGSGDWTAGTNTWERFLSIEQFNPGNAAVGNCHFAPNSESDYDWGNPTKVWSSWRDWRDNYPNLTGEKELVDCSVWGYGDNIDHKVWWFSCFPHVAGRDEKGYSHNWWEYYQKFVYTVNLEVYIDGKLIQGTFPLQKGQTYDFQVFAALSDRTRIDVTDDCVIESRLYYSVNQKTGKLTGLSAINDAYITVWRDGRNFSVTEAQNTATVTAIPSPQRVLVNGYEIAFDAYNISGNNYFKLRDLAYVLNYTEKRFGVDYDAYNNTILLTSNASYIPNNSEMADKSSGNKTAIPSPQKVSLDGKKINLTAYNIDGSNYFKLRDIGQIFDFGVTWDGTNNTIVIDTGIGYTGE